MYPAARFWRETKLDHIDHICAVARGESEYRTTQEEVFRRTKVDDIKHFRTLVLRNARK